MISCPVASIASIDKGRRLGEPTDDGRFWMRKLQFMKTTFPFGLAGKNSTSS